MNTQSIYNNIDFQDEPYSTNNKFAVYVPKQEQSKLSQTQQQFNTQNNSTKNALQSHRVEFKDQQSPTSKIEQLQQNSSAINLQSSQPQNIQEQQPHQQNVQAKRSVTQSRQYQNYKSPRTANLNYSNKFQSQTPSSSVMKQRTIQQFKDSLYFDERINKVPKSTITNHVIDSIVNDADLLLQKQDLMHSIYKLKQLNLLKNKEFQVNRLPGIGKSSFVYNDYHTKSTNNGYSRNFGGVFYTR